VTAFSAADTGIVAVRQGDLVSNDLSLDLVRPFPTRCRSRAG